MRLCAALTLGFLTAGFAWQCAEAKSKKEVPTTGPEGLRYAAVACDLPTLKTLIASGVDISAADASGFDALSRASLNRHDMREKLQFGWKLICPQAVEALTGAGADPWKAKFYQNPRLDELQPGMIAVIRVEDNRRDKGQSEKLMEEMTDGVEQQLAGHVARNSPRLGYPVLSLNEARKRLLASGFSAEDAIAPDRIKACKALGVDSVFEASLEDYRSRSAGIVSAAGMRLKFALIDCKGGELLWRSDQDYTLAEGFLVRSFGGGKLKQVITGFVDGNAAVEFPRYLTGRK
jgi:hypothetical protein